MYTYKSARSAELTSWNAAFRLARQLRRSLSTDWMVRAAASASTGTPSSRRTSNRRTVAAVPAGRPLVLADTKLLEPESGTWSLTTVGCRRFDACFAETWLVAEDGVEKAGEITGAATVTRVCPRSASTVTAARALVPTRPSTITPVTARTTPKPDRAPRPDWGGGRSPPLPARRGEPSERAFCHRSLKCRPVSLSE